MHFDVVIVGSSHAGTQAAIALRKEGFDGTVAIISDERELPYERPPLSKEYLLGKRALNRILIRPETFWAERNIELKLGHSVIRIDAQLKIVSLSDNSSMSYGKLIWAAGGAPNLPDIDGLSFQGVHAIRSLQDCNQIMHRLPEIEDVAIIGGGYIGLEAAVALRELGKRVTLLEAESRVLARVAGPPISAFIANEHRLNGVDLRTRCLCSEILGEAGSVKSILLEDGIEIEAQLVIIGIGITPSITPLRNAGAECQNGVQVDAECRTTLADVYAIGDCAARVNPFSNGKIVRLESVDNANHHAGVAARSILGKPPERPSVPWFWSNQYDLRLQTIGISTGHDDYIVRGCPEERAFTVVYLRERKVIALDCVNRTKDYVQGRRLIERGIEVDPEQVRDPGIPLKDLPSL